MHDLIQTMNLCICARNCDLKCCVCVRAERLYLCVYDEIVWYVFVYVCVCMCVCTSACVNIYITMGYESNLWHQSAPNSSRVYRMYVYMYACRVYVLRHVCTYDTCTSQSTHQQLRWNSQFYTLLLKSKHHTQCAGESQSCHTEYSANVCRWSAQDTERVDLPGGRFPSIFLHIFVNDKAFPPSFTFL